MVDERGSDITQEIEKKCLIRENGVEYATEEFFQLYHSIDSLKDDVLARGKVIRQGYIPIEVGKEIAEKLRLDFGLEPAEARLRENCGKYYFTLKTEGSCSRNEVEVEVPFRLFKKYWLSTSGRQLEKVRLEIPYEGYTLEVDVYTDRRDLIICEVEVPTVEAAERLKLVGLDVTDKQRYKNKNLAK